MFFLSISLLISAQAPTQISYQGVARNSSGTVISNQQIAIKFDIRQSSASGAVVFTEQHTGAAGVTTNAFGLFTTYIGSINNLGVVNWANGPFFIEVSIDPANGTAYSSLGSQQLMSVPFALYAQTSGNSSSNPTITINSPNTISNPSVGVYSITVPSSSLSLNNNSLTISNGNTVVLPTATYSAGNGIDISGGIISNTLVPITPTININAPNSVTNSSTGTYDIFIPAGSVYTLTSNSNTITLNNGTSVSSVTVPAVSYYTISANSNTITLDNGTAITTATVPVAALYTLSASSNSITLNNGSSVSTVTVPVYSAGNGIDISPSGVISNTAPAVSTTITSGGVVNVTPTGSNSYLIDVPAPSFSYNPGTNELTLTQNGATTTATLNGTGSNTVSITGAGMASVNPTTGSSFTVSVPNPTLSVNSGSISISNGNAVSLPVQTLSVGGGSIAISGGNAVAIPSSSTTLVQGSNVTLNQSGSTYTISAPAYSISLPGGNVAQITNGITTSTAPISPTNLTLSGSNNNILSAGGNTIGLNTYTVGNNLNISGGPNYTISAASYSLSANSNTLTLSNGAAVTTVTVPQQTLPLLTYTNTAAGGVLQSGPITNTVSIPNYTLSNTSNTITLNNGTVNSTAIVPVPTLTLVGSTLQSGPTTNTVSLSGIGGIYGGSGAIPTGSTTVTVATNTLTFLSGTTTNKSIANFYGGGITGTHLAIGHITTNPATIKLLGSVNTTPVDYGYVSGSSNGISMSGGASSNGLFVTNSAEVGVGTYTTGTGKFVVTSAASSTAPTAHFRETGVSQLVRLKLSNTNVSGKYFEIASDNNGTDVNAAFSVNYHNGSNYRPVFLITGDYKAVVHNLNTALASLHVMDTTNNGGGIASEGFNKPGVLVLARNNQPGFGSRLAVSAGDELGRISFSGYAGGTYGSGPKIFARAMEAYTGSGNGSELVFTTVPIGTTSQLEVMKLQSNGNVVINPNQYANAILNVRGSMRLDSTLTMSGHNNIPFQSPLNEGRIYFDRPSGKFKVSENGGAYVDLISPGANIWSSGVNTVFLANTINKVGIGTTTPSSLLHVVSSVPAPSNFILGNVNQPNIEWEWRVDGLSNLSLNNENNGSPFTSLFLANTGKIGINTTSPSAQLAIVNTFTSSEGVFIDNNSNTHGIRVYQAGTGDGIYAHINNSLAGAGFAGITNSNGTFFSGENVGTGSVASFNINNTSNGNYVLNATTNGFGKAIQASAAGGYAIYASNSSSTTATIFAENSGISNTAFFQAGQGTAIYARNTSTVGNSVMELSSYGNGSALQVYKNTGSTGSVASFANFETSNGSDAVIISNTGAANSLYVAKPAGSTTGSAAKIDNISTANFADVLLVSNNGGGAAIHAITGPTVTGGSNTALWVESGHLKATGTSVTTGSLNVSGGFVTPSFAPILTNCNDVKGTFSFTTSATGIVAGGYIELEIKFSKPYSVAPTVVASPVTDLQGLNYMVTNVTTSSFFVRVYRSSNTNITLPTTIINGSMFKFNYLVIE